MKDLQPTLWRTCRVLANSTRLELLRELFKLTDCSVADLATAVKISDSQASLFLREINARGLISARRSGRNVFYSAIANPNVEHADTLLNALRIACVSGIKNDEIIHFSTAFSHPRRLRMVATLREKPVVTQYLSFKTGISVPALHRHLRKLIDRDMIEIVDEYCQLKTPGSLFAQTLQKIALMQGGS